MGNIVTCIKRVYSIQMSNGMKMEVESEKPLSGVTTAKLLEDDSDINSFLENIKILDIKVPQAVVHGKISYKKKHGKKLKKDARLKKEKISLERDISPRGTHVQSENRLTPCDRINMMITMEGEFTRLDYQKFIEDKGYKMSNFMGYGDIEDAVMLKRIATTGEKIGRGRKKYRIIDVMPVEQYMFRKILKMVSGKNVVSSFLERYTTPTLSTHNDTMLPKDVIFNILFLDIVETRWLY